MSTAEYYYRKAVEANPVVSMWTRTHMQSVQMEAANKWSKCKNSLCVSILLRAITFILSLNVQMQTASAHANLGAFLHLAKKHLEAEPHYRKALELNPTDMVTRNNLIKLQSVIGRN